MNCHLRIARPVFDIEATRKMYCDGLQLQVIGYFANHEGFDGIMLGMPNSNYHFEFTYCRHHVVNPSSTLEDLFVFYEGNTKIWNDMCNNMVTAGFIEVSSFNPYWSLHGRTFQDCNGYRIVVQNDLWENTVYNFPK